jgi:hypothetical protein
MKMIEQCKLIFCLRTEAVITSHTEKPVHKGKFTSVPAIAPDGTAHLQTRVYPDGISYITKLLHKKNLIWSQEVVLVFL